jgi:L-alanine-DL-glutamate epimerase-like enolase superfamily enzyme
MQALAQHTSFNAATRERSLTSVDMRDVVRIEDIRVSVFEIPTDAPESDGTYKWRSTKMVLVEASAGGKHSLGYTYASTAAATLINDELKRVVIGRDATSVNAAWVAMVHHVRNIGRPGIASMAISAIDTALWDLKARLLELPLVTLLGQVRDAMPIYGSGGFTSYSDDKLQEQLGNWVEQGIPRVKMKVGRNPYCDPHRVAAAHQAIGESAELFVDANGAYSRKQALELAYVFSKMHVTWFEEPVSSDDLEGLRLMRDHGPPGIDLAAGEYGFDITYFERMLDAGSVDVLQADATRCGGFTGFLQAASVAEAHHIPLSSHCAPALHLHVGCAARPLRHAEYFHDHVRIENIFFDGVSQPENGMIKPDISRPGMGLELKAADAKRYQL